LSGITKFSYIMQSIHGNNKKYLRFGGGKLKELNDLSEESYRVIVLPMIKQMFDTQVIIGHDANPFGKDSDLKQNGVKSFPSDLVYVLRSIQLIKGMGMGMNVGKGTNGFSVLPIWYPYAKEYVREYEQEHTANVITTLKG